MLESVLWLFFFNVFLYAVLYVGGVSMCVLVPNVVSIKLVCDKPHGGSSLRNMEMYSGSCSSRL